MQAAYYERTGLAKEVLKIGELPTPLPGPGEVRIKIAWSGVNPSDVKSRAGIRTKTLPYERIIPHSDGSGIIDLVGNGVAPGRVGERVWVWNAAWMRAFGTAAQYVVLPSNQAVPLPDNVDLAAGACLGIPALTAYNAVTVNGGVLNQVVLVAGGSGAVGHYAIQLAKIKGARRVIATVSGTEKAILAREAGADIVFNYRTDDLPATIQEVTEGQGIDRIIEVDFAVNVDKDIEVLKPGGEVVVYGSSAPDIRVPFSASIRKGLRITFFIVYSLSMEVRERAILDLTAMMREYLIHHNIAARFPLTQIAEAHDLVENGQAKGNVILMVEQ
jgi:NADPH2:quinone reductase